MPANSNKRFLRERLPSYFWPDWKRRAIRSERVGGVLLFVLPCDRKRDWRRRHLPLFSRNFRPETCDLHQRSVQRSYRKI